MLCTAHIQVYILPVSVNLRINKCLVVLRIHIAQVISRTSGESRHGVQFQREDGLVVDQFVGYHLVVYGVPSPVCSVSQWRLTGFGRQEFAYFRQFQRQTAFWNHIRHVVLVIYRERLTPIALAAEDGITQTEVHLHASQIVFLYIFLGGSDGLFHGQTVQ